MAAAYLAEGPPIARLQMLPNDLVRYLVYELVSAKELAIPDKP